MSATRTKRRRRARRREKEAQRRRLLVQQLRVLGWEDMGFMFGEHKPPEYQAWMDFMIKITCSIFDMDPSDPKILEALAE